MRTPLRPHWLCAASIAIYASWPALMAAYWSGVLESGISPPDGDTVIIPIVNGFAMTMLLSPLFAVVLWLSLRCYRGGVPIFARPAGFTSWLWTGFYASIAAALVAVTITALSFHVSGLRAIHAAFALAVLAQLRAATVLRRSPVLPAKAGIS